jgi:hypothetical protein
MMGCDDEGAMTADRMHVPAMTGLCIGLTEATGLLTSFRASRAIQYRYTS